ncbi:ADP-forming succinate--CoA ligase subunit beta [Coxiella endosymbiont of Amblyomma americanum]|uniref:ADP-forming succinate--CoA ligase subunit beta n=1 Tax=Coxiella endosymbiont of Amblyomma americanum TaxID=325775 RepID=UPI00058082CA|nr:ADP-forming succinate--CoA ligase subunit beta [Coxiella endosymbiont of Amblyomma americanum]AJC50295.1 succinyl-CoA synthetase subunit beta [Coxiella endosymbiont of Amblyomma americanum]AUJ58646.1 succinate--CoA ligase subunit beta [Coxiella-like endosymbiont of Amblyomma americanum]
MNLHEYQSKRLLKKYGIPVPLGKVVSSVESAVNAADKIGDDCWVVKAQVHAGGRGKSGGVCLVKGKKELQAVVKDLLGKRLVTYQTSKYGQMIKQVLIEKKSNILQELYLSMTIDRSIQKIVLLASTEGGVEIETVLMQSPGKILKIVIDPVIGLQPFQGRQLFFNLNLDLAQMQSFTDIVVGLYQLFIAYDLSLLEINPLAVTDMGELLCLDVKLDIDDNALYRQSNLQEMRDITQEDEFETLARQQGLSYFKLDGNIGCMVNGAGLAMATMDLITLEGGEPANFLDVGGSVTKNRVVEAFKVIIADRNVKGILVNIFGGIVRCDLIAEGIIDTVKKIGIHVPVVVRLEGNNAKLGTEKLMKSNANIVTIRNFSDAAKEIVAQVKKKIVRYR